LGKAVLVPLAVVLAVALGVLAAGGVVDVTVDADVEVSPVTISAVSWGFSFLAVHAATAKTAQQVNVRELMKRFM
jgi:hypothetical protein